MRGPQTAKTTRARSLRKVDNDAESALWAELRDRRLNGHKFVRQLPIGIYFADFACREEKLVVEVDGSQHAESHRDRLRDSFMVSQGWSVLRLWNSDVLKEKDAVFETVLAALERRLDCDIVAADLRFVASQDYREKALLDAGAAPHPYPLPVKNGEREASALPLVPFPRPSRGEGPGSGVRRTGGTDLAGSTSFKRQPS